MLVCNVSHRPRRTAIAVAVAETATAVDATATGNIVFATLVDDPASVGDIVNAYLGEIMLEMAGAIDAIDTGLLYSGTVDEILTAISTEDAVKALAFTTFNPVDLFSVTLTNGNLTATGGIGAAGVRGIASKTSGKFYWEYKIDFIQTNGLTVGICLATTTLSTTSLVGVASTNRLGNIQVNNSGTLAALGTRAVNDIIGIAVDFTAALLWLRVAPSGNWNGSGTANPATGIGGISISAISTGALYPVFISGGNGDKITANFGATAFSGAVPSGFTSGL